MNKFRILGVIAIIAIIANFFGGLDENWRDFKKGFEDGHIFRQKWPAIGLTGTCYKESVRFLPGIRIIGCCG